MDAHVEQSATDLKVTDQGDSRDFECIVCSLFAISGLRFIPWLLWGVHGLIVKKRNINKSELRMGANLELTEITSFQLFAC